MVRSLHTLLSLLSLLVLISTPAFAVAPTVKTPDSGIARLQAFQANVRSMEARFRQQVIDAEARTFPLELPGAF